MSRVIVVWGACAWLWTWVVACAPAAEPIDDGAPGAHPRADDGAAEVTAAGADADGDARSQSATAGDGDGAGAPGPGAAGNGEVQLDAGADTTAPGSVPAANSCDEARCDPEEASCSVSQGRASCTCATGYRDAEGDGSRCEEIDECAEGAATCADNARCVNTPRGYACLCEGGHHGDGQVLCERNVACPDRAPASRCGGTGNNCVDYDGSGDVCVCRTGFEGDGVVCSDRDECAGDLHDCHPVATCENHSQGFACHCPEGHIGDGHGGSGCFLPESRLTEPRIPELGGAPCAPFEVGTYTPTEWPTVTLRVGNRAAEPTGALLFYWTANVTNDDEVERMLPEAMLGEILDAGGIIVTFNASVGGEERCAGPSIFSEDDLALADVIAACAVRDHSIDPARIYTTGCSLGGLQAGCMAVSRAAYVAAVTTNSGGLMAEERLRAAHAPAALTMIEGVELIPESTYTSQVLTQLASAYGAESVQCRHGRGYCGADEALQLGAWQFMKDHPFGTARPYFDQGLPPTLPDYCSNSF